MPYSRPDAGSLPPGSALMPGAFPPMAGAPPGAPVPLVLAPGFPPGAPGLPPMIEREPVDVCKLFVGGLNPNTTEAELEDYFKQYGAVRRPPPVCAAFVHVLLVLGGISSSCVLCLSPCLVLFDPYII